MRKAINIGIITGVILTIILIVGTLSRMLLKANTGGANLIFTILFISAIIVTLWMAMNRYCRSLVATWSNLSIVAVITSITTAILFGGASLIYTKYFSTEYLSYLKEQTKENWLSRNYSAQNIASQGEWTLYNTAWNFSFNNLQVMLVVLFAISLFIAFVYYSKNRNKVPLHENHNNHELIF